MADGTIYIDTSLDASGFDSGSKKMEETIDDTSSKIQKILSNTEKSAKSKAASIAAIYRKQGLNQQEAFRKAWEEIERDTTKGVNSVKKGLSQIGNQSQTTGKSMISNIGGAFKKLGAVLASAFVVKEFVQFGKEAIALGSDLQEVQNVVDVTFTTMSDKVDEFARNAAKTSGLSETMAKKYTGTFGSMAKAFGFAEEDAFKMSTALTQLSGDVASFYNLSQDEAYTKLKSVFTGETESLKDLGVVMTQTALDSYAMSKGFGKTTSQMSEQEKVALRYSFVLDQLSLASGDFQRTSDGWANQMRIMSLNIESLKANIGQGLINLFTPVIQAINTLIERMSVLGVKFKEFTELVMGKQQAKGVTSTGKAVAELGENYALTSGGIDDFTKSLSKSSKEAKKSLSPLDDLNNLTSNVAENLQPEGLGSLLAPTTQTGTSATVGIDVEGIENLDKVKSFLSAIIEQFNKIKSVITDIYTKYIKPVLVDFIGDVIYLGSTFTQWFSEKIIPIVIDFKDKFVQVWQEKIEPIIKRISEYISRAWNEVLMPFFEWLGEKLGVFLPPFIEGIGEKFINAFEQMMETAGFFLDALNGLIDFVVGVFTGDWERAWNGLKEVFKGIINALISMIEGFVNFAIDSLNAIIKGANSLGGSIGIEWTIPTIPKLDIPKLATGAVIPPNAPFMAMLGDQRNGRNLEAPEGLIRQIMREELGQIALNVTFEVQGDEAGIFNVTQRQAIMYTKQTGKPAYPTGG